MLYTTVNNLKDTFDKVFHCMTSKSQEHQDKLSFKKLKRKATEENLVKITVSKAEPIIM